MKRLFFNDLKTSLFVLIGATMFSCAETESIEQEISKELTGFSTSRAAAVQPIARFRNTNAPEVYMGLKDVSELADFTISSNWVSLRENIKGVYVNLLGTGTPTVSAETNFKKILGKLGAKHINRPNSQNKGAIFVASLRERTPDFTLQTTFWDYYETAFQAGYRFNKKALIVVNDYITKQVSYDRFYRPGDYNRTKNFARNTQPNGTGIFPFNNIYIATRNGHWENDVYNPVKDTSTDSSGNLKFPYSNQAYSTLVDSQGIIYERNPVELHSRNKFRNSYIEAFNAAHLAGKEFVWLCPRGNAGTNREFFDGLVDTYNWMRSEGIFPDRVVLINYTRQQTPFKVFPILSAPNKPAITFTGALYWLTEQHLGKTPINP